MDRNGGRGNAAIIAPTLDGKAAARGPEVPRVVDWPKRPPALRVSVIRQGSIGTNGWDYTN
jgi:hypothetical protein